MISGLEDLVNCTVLVVTYDGRVFVGSLEGFDQLTNLILNQSEERVYRCNSPVERLKLGLFVIRGDNVVLIGEVDNELDFSTNFDQISASAIGPIIA
ncbi:U6 snRNA-associated Sm-like protein LSm8 [Babesia microti strain RI]|uniref:U6 snRNA-associated Sm-like protein LSm8 n=1 Tax=Babesia microti (strain RI) TaxID=1133968 RepID=A0A1N6LWQ9_BABMR|nr:U6 snRNA-associated Sm-like protein LSm8 [Babesia microti strain RI]SIO73302.1 U6 snRNA-associated Sm-like protein LSm8 [Babesia microti strain RI]|eukprot:XP_021337404.1 U6 snRNA-associated Sm-like protein LSm8 [Babesia microti strain RI]